MEKIYRVKLNKNGAPNFATAEEIPQGEWIKDNLGTVICSECKRPRRDNRIGHINFCNSCGARMRPKLQGKHFDSIIIDESAMKGADDDN